MELVEANVSDNYRRFCRMPVDHVVSND